MTRIAPKQFSYLMDLAARGTGEFDAYADQIGWPWRATQAQLDEWNAWAMNQPTR